MTEGVVRSGRRGAGPRAPAPGEPLDVVVVGPGPIATGVAAWFSRLRLDQPADQPADQRAGQPRGQAEPGRWTVGAVRALDRLPDEEPHLELAGAGVVVLVAYAGDLATALQLRGADRTTDAVAQTQRTLAAARAAGVHHVVVVTSAMVHGAWAGREVATDDAPLLPVAKVSPDSEVAALLAVEAVVARSARRRTPLVTVLRPAAVVGPRVDTLITRHFEAPRLLTVRGGAREWQLVHVDDVASAVATAVGHGLTGALTVGATGFLTSAQVEMAAGMQRIELAAVTAFGTAERLHRVGVLPAPADDLGYAVYPWTVASDRLLAAGWAPQWSNEQCLEVLLEAVRGRHALAGRRVGPRDAAALGAAGAAVALIGTAAVWRQARSRRRH